MHIVVRNIDFDAMVIFPDAVPRNNGKRDMPPVSERITTENFNTDFKKFLYQNLRKPYLSLDFLKLVFCDAL